MIIFTKQYKLSNDQARVFYSCLANPEVHESQLLNATLTVIDMIVNCKDTIYGSQLALTYFPILNAKW